MTEVEARQHITRWAKQHFAPERGDPTPNVEIISLSHDAKEDERQAELAVSTSADNPHVTFFMDDRPGYGLQVASVEY
jgi:hypothetical protein